MLQAFICHPSDSAVLADARIKHWPVLQFGFIVQAGHHLAIRTVVYSVQCTSPLQLDYCMYIHAQLSYINPNYGLHTIPQLGYIPSQRG